MPATVRHRKWPSAEARCRAVSGFMKCNTVSQMGSVSSRERCTRARVSRGLGISVPYHSSQVCKLRAYERISKYYFPGQECHAVRRQLPVSRTQRIPTLPQHGLFERAMGCRPLHTQRKHLTVYMAAVQEPTTACGVCLSF